MRDRLDEFGTAEVAVVTFTDPARLPSYVERLGLPFPVVSDVDQKLYRALGVERGTRRQVWSLGTLRMYGSLLRSGRRLRRAHEDTRQLGADIIVARDGTIAKLILPSTPDTRPSVDVLLTALRNA